MSDQPEHYNFRIEVYTGQLVISATYTITPYRRLSDALNSDLSEYMPLTDAIISPLEYPQQAQRVTQMLVARREVFLITALHEPDPPADYQPGDQSSAREVETVMFFTARFAIRANFYRRPDIKLAEMLEQRSADFIPISDVRVIPFSSSRPQGRDFACLRRGAIQALYRMPDA